MTEARQTRKPELAQNPGIGEPKSRKLATLCFSAGSLLYFHLMSRLPRLVVVDVPHHVTQRGNARQAVLGNDVRWR